MKKPSINIGKIAEQAIELLKENPQGLTMLEMRKLLNAEADSQEHFNRRIRSIRKLYDLHRLTRGREHVYVLGNAKAKLTDSGVISGKLRAEVLHLAFGRCQMCGRSIEEDKVKLQIDHKIPQTWGGLTVKENLWALCEQCNHGKRDFFSSFDEDEMLAIAALDSVHERIAQLLRINIGKEVPAYLIEFVANIKDQQVDWRKRLRELRYPVVGLNIEVSKKRNSKGVQSFYRLIDWKALPANLTAVIKNFERENKLKADGDA
jgi:predicted Zn-ribbon and HTH transcriptional regulator